MQQLASEKWSFLSAFFIVLVAHGCGSGDQTQVEPQGSVCTPDPEVEPKGCRVQDENTEVNPDGSYKVTSPETLEPICSSRCTRMEEVWIYDFPELENLGALGRVDRLEQGLTVENNQNLNSLQGLDLDFAFTVKVLGNPSLESLKGLGPDTEIKGTLAISNNPKLDNLESLEWLEEFTHTNGGRLQLRGNGLSSLEGLQNLSFEGRGGEIRIDNENKLTDLQGFGDIGALERLILVRNDSLESLEGLEELDSVTYDLRITDNPNLPACKIDEFVDRIDDEIDSSRITISDNGGYDHPVCE